MSVQPTGLIYFLKGVPLDKNCDDTFYFDPFGSNASVQFQKFYGYKKYEFSNVTYQRVGRNKIRVQKNADDLRQCNYVMFQNFNYSSKWFYAFVDSVEYVNDNVTEVSYVLDDLQTYYFDIDVEMSFVEREHSSTDEIGDNVIDEGLGFGDLIITNKVEKLYTESGSGVDYKPMYKCVVFYVPDSTDGKVVNPTHQPDRDVPPFSPTISKPNTWVYDVYNYTSTDDLVIPWRATIANGVFFGTTYYALPFDIRTDVSYSSGSKDWTYLDDTRNKIVCLLDTLVENKCTVVNVCLIPTEVWEADIGGNGYSVFGTLDETVNFLKKSGKDIQHPYTPKNRKLLCYPYKRILLSNNTGGTNELRWEECATTVTPDNVKRFGYYIKGTAIPTCEIAIIPNSYRGTFNYTDTLDYENALILNDFPQLSWNENSFNQWWAQNRTTFSLSMISSVIGGLASVISGGASAQNNVNLGSNPTVQWARFGSNAFSAIDGVVKSAYPYIIARNTPDQAFGNLSCSSLKTYLGRIGFTIYELSIDSDNAKAIDDYFTMFGYACKKVKLPNVYTNGGVIRTYWNYFKTTGAKVHSKGSMLDTLGVPQESLNNIIKIFDHGITFWKPDPVSGVYNGVGDYSAENSPIL